MAEARCAPTAHGAERTIGVITPQVGGFYFGGIVNGVTRAAGNAGHRVIAVQTIANRLDREVHPRKVVAGAPYALDVVDGVVIVTDAVPAHQIVRIEEWHRPVVLVSASDIALRAPTILPDNAGGARAAVEHLLEHGHTKIGFVGSLSERDVKERFGGYRQALADHGIRMRSEWLFEASTSEEAGGTRAAERFFAAGAPTTAVVAGTDLNAIGFMKALRSHNLLLPRDQAVIGFDHIESGARLVPRLSTVNLRHCRAGELAVHQLLAQMRGEEATHQVQRVPATLLTRESCGCNGASTTGEILGGRSTTPDTRLAPGRAQMHRLAASAFGGPVGLLSCRYADDVTRAGWIRAVLEPLDRAVEQGGVPTTETLERLNDLTAALQPHPEALEQCIAALREVEAELGVGLVVGSTRLAALREATTDVLLAVVRGCTRPALGRNGYLERILADQYEVDMDLFSCMSESPRMLTWLPSGMRGAACLGLWVDAEGSPEGREIEIVGTRGKPPGLAQLIGHRMSAGQFPPATLTRSEKVDNSRLTFVLPVMSSTKDWGILALNGHAESQAPHARDRYQHWAALLATALDHEACVDQLTSHARALTEAASCEHSLADEVRTRDGRHRRWMEALEHGTWDWDVSAGSVYYSHQWKRALGYLDDEIGSSPAEWFDRVHPDDRGGLSAGIAAVLGGAQAPLSHEHRVRSSSGEYIWMMCRAVVVLDDAGCPSRLVGALVDRTERKRQELALSRGVLRDEATGLAGRLLFLELLGGAIDRARRSATFDCAVVLVRVLAGADRCDGDADAEARLTTIERLRSILRAQEAARLGPDDFAILVEGSGADDGRGHTTELLARLQDELGGSVAVGVLESVRPFQDAGEVLRTAGIVLLRDRAGLESATTATSVTGQALVTPDAPTQDSSTDPS